MKKKINHLLILALIVTISLFIIMNSNTNCNNTEFKITKEECLNETFELELSKVINGERTITVYDIGKTKLINLAVEINLGEQCFNESAKKCKGYYEVCEDVEVEEMKEIYLQCYAVGNWGNKNVISAEYVQCGLDNIFKQELSTEWLDENCLCEKEVGIYVDEECYKNQCLCLEYKCGSYTIEVLN